MKLTRDCLDRVAFPLGGLGAGMICLEGTGALSHVSLRHKPDIHHEPQMFAALHVKGATIARVIEGPVPMWKAFGSVSPGGLSEAGNGLTGRTYGLPRFANATFEARFPFATVKLTDKTMPVAVEVIGWSPFTPGATDDSCLPVAALEYRLTNRSTKPVKAVFSFHAANFMKVCDGADVGVMPGGFVVRQGPLPDKPAAVGAFAAFTDEPAKVDAAWFRGGWFDALTMVWKHVAAGDCVEQAPQAGGSGGSLYVPVTLKAKASKTVRLQALSGARYDAVEKTLYLKPAVKGDFRAFLCTATGFGTVGVRQGKPFVEVVTGDIPVQRIEY